MADVTKLIETDHREVLYPVVRSDVPDGAKLADEGKDEHGEARQAVPHHVSAEESEMLPKSRQALSAERLDELGTAFQPTTNA